MPRIDCGPRGRQCTAGGNVPSEPRSTASFQIISGVIVLERNLAVQFVEDRDVEIEPVSPLRQERAGGEDEHPCVDARSGRERRRDEASVLDDEAGDFIADHLDSARARPLEQAQRMLH